MFPFAGRLVVFNLYFSPSRLYYEVMIKKSINSVLSIPVSQTYRQLILLSFLAFSLPFSLGHPQGLVGVLVNAILVVGALKLPAAYYWPLALFPSLGILSRGLLFGPLTTFLVYFLPGIWLANLVYLKLFGRFQLDGDWIVIPASLAKTVVLFTLASIFYKLKLVPELYLQIMGLNQLLTALAGGFIGSLTAKKL
jgi:hypothetical protein